MKGADDKLKNVSLKVTEDGSHTLFSEYYNQTYHNSRGAVTESRHLFFEQNGLTQALRKRDQINILEIGFGTGLNLALMLDCYKRLKSGATVEYVSIEAHPISARLAGKLNFGDYLGHPEVINQLPSILRNLKKGLNRFKLGPGLPLSLFYGYFDDFSPEISSFNFIFQDAFSPTENPELWTGRVFSQLLKWSAPEGILTTYCAASKVRGAMAAAGWKVARANGAPGKREMTIASPAEQTLENFTRVNEMRLAERYNEDDF